LGGFIVAQNKKTGAAPRKRNRSNGRKKQRGAARPK